MVVKNVKVQSPEFRIEFDPSKCWWCLACELACSLYHEGECSRSFSRLHIELDLLNGEVTGHICRQCEFPACLYACPIEGALTIDEETGSRIINEENCIGCGLCARNCPYNGEGWVIRSRADKRKFFKCDLCGGTPQCVEICPTKALTYRRS